MTTGTYISGAAHVALILFLLLSGLFTRDRFSEVTVAEVSVISEAEYAALVLRAPAPQVAEEAQQPAAPAPETAAPSPPTADAPPPETAVPETAAVPEAPEDVPEPPELTVPEAEVSTVVPVIQAPPTTEDGDTIAPQATPAPAQRVTPDPTPMPPPDAERSPTVVEETAPAPEPEAETVVEVTPAAAPEAATTEIVTEAETPDELAPARSIRPRSMPPRPVRAAETPRTPPDTPPRDPVADAVAAAVAEANRPAAAPAVASGPPLNFGEKEALRVAVSSCWNVDVGSRSADVTVTVAVSMNRDGTVANGAVRQVFAQGGDAEAQRSAFEKARRAILRCQRSGFPLPPDKYDQWREIEMTFNPEGMRLR